MNKTDAVREERKGTRQDVRVTFETTLTNGTVVVGHSQWVPNRSSLPWESIEMAKTKYMDELNRSAAITGEKPRRVDVYEEVRLVETIERTYTKRTLVELSERRRGELWG